MSLKSPTPLLEKFIESHCQIGVGADFRVGKTEFYDQFVSWVRESGGSEDSVPSMTSVGRDMQQRGFCEVRTKTLRSWGGIRIASAAKEEVETQSEPIEAAPPQHLQPQLALLTVGKPKTEHSQTPFTVNPSVNLLLLRAMNAIEP